MFSPPICELSTGLFHQKQSLKIARLFERDLKFFKGLHTVHERTHCKKIRDLC